MSVVFTCECGRKTTEPYIIGGVKMCVICAEDIDPKEVDKREKINHRAYEKYQLADKTRYGRFS